VGRDRVPHSLGPEAEPAAVTVNIDPFFANPIAARMLAREKLDEVKPDGDPVVTLEAVCDMNETLLVEAENQRRAQNRSKINAQVEQIKKGRG